MKPIPEIFREVEESGGWVFRPTQYKTLNRYLQGGFYNPEFVILAARPSFGKTSLALNWCVHFAKLGETVCFYSLESSGMEIVDRVTKIANTIDGLGSFFVDDTPAIDVDYILDTAGDLEPDLVVVDYLQLMSALDPTGNNATDIGEISKGLKIVAKELDTTLIAISQLNRAVDLQEGDKRPRMVHLRESGQLEQDADVILFLYYQDYYRTLKRNDHLYELSIGKQRIGPRDTIVRLQFFPEQYLFEEYDAMV